MTRRGRQIIARRTVIRTTGIDGEILDRLEELQIIVPVRRPGKERAYGPRDLDRLRVYGLLIQELGVNPAGAEIIFRLRDQLLDLRLRLSAFLEQARQEGLLEELQRILDDLDDDGLG